MPGAQGRGVARRARELQPGDDHDRPGVRRRDLRRADHRRVRREGDREGAPRRAARDARRSDRPQHRHGAGRGRRAREVRRRADRGLHRGHRAWREPSVVQAHRRGARRRSRPLRDLPHARGVLRGLRGPRLADGGPPQLHDGRHRLGDGLRRGRPAPDRRSRPRCLADHRGAPRGVDHRLEGVRARGDARHRGQRGDRVLDREPRPHGRAHRRLDHGGAGHDADRPRVPAPARPLDRHHPLGRRRHRRVQHPVRGQPRRRSGDRHRDEPAGLALQRAGLEGDRLPDRQDRGQGGDRLHPGRDPQRHHPGDAGKLRADARLRGGQGPALRLREVPGGRPDADDPHEVGRRGDGDRPQLHRGAAEGAAVAGGQEGGLRVRARPVVRPQPGRRCSTRSGRRTTAASAR